MIVNKPLLILGASLALSLPVFAQAGAKEDFKEVYEKAEATHNEAGTFKWTTTVNQLAAAKEAAGGGDFEKALDMAERALKLAEESVHQREQQEEMWPSVAIGN